MSPRLRAFLGAVLLMLSVGVTSCQALFHERPGLGEESPAFIPMSETAGKPAPSDGAD